MPAVSKEKNKDLDYITERKEKKRTQEDRQWAEAGREKKKTGSRDKERDEKVTKKEQKQI